MTGLEEMSGDDDLESLQSVETREGPINRSAMYSSKRLLLFGILPACALIIAMLGGIGVEVRTTQRIELRQQKKVCDGVRASIADWSILLASRALALGSAMSAQQHMGFLMPGEGLSNIIAADVRFLDATRTVANPSLGWHPAVAAADREAYETLMSATHGFAVKITHTHDESTPERSTYYPLSAVWGHGDALPEVVNATIGRDAAHNTLNSALSARLYDERKVTASTPFDSSGKPVVNDALMVSVPYCGVQGCDDDAATILGLVVHSVRAQDWGSLFPETIAITAVGGDKIKSVDASRYSGFVEAYESYAGLELRCHYDKSSMFQTVGELLLLGSIILLISILLFMQLGFLHVKAVHSQDRSEWVESQLRILNTMPDAIVSMTFKKNDEPSMIVLNLGGDHMFNGTSETIALSSVVSPRDLARVRAWLQDPSPKPVEFHSRFGESERCITYEVAVSPFVASDSMSHERICVFRDVSERVQREEESRRAEASLARAEERLAAKALARAEERLSDNVKRPASDDSIIDLISRVRVPQRAADTTRVV